uniref:common plant regulatory factor 1-like n=1 Tax=Erigeron canadensis TaxID=72917 RepID=UPI001CB8CDFE|nr:common plant regulatory factor 1-like [Erigeron canadensis]XP_043622304.1 common plant regulatory factor 1-like [Erigeron canadensis]
MGSFEEARTCKSEKSSSPSPPPPPASEHQQASVQAYHDWAAMQAYYGPRMAVPAYYNSAVASGHPPPAYMWAPPQHMIPPYAAMYPHGGVYPHPGVPLPSPMSIDSPAKSSGNSDRGLMKKLKGFDGLAMSIGNGNGDSAAGGNDNEMHHSGETEGSSEGSDGNTTEGLQNSGKRNHEESPNTPAKVSKTEPLSGQFFLTEPDGASKKVTALTPASLKVSDSELKNSPAAAAGTTSATLAMVPSEGLLQNERELKRERRKQSNRESARRSRLRKQAEAEELAIKVEALTSENLNLKSEINRLTDNSEKLTLLNAKLMEKLKNAEHKQVSEDPRAEPKGLSLSTANLLSRVDNGSSSSSVNGEGEVYESNNNQKSGAKLRQLLDASPRADAVAAN